MYLRLLQVAMNLPNRTIKMRLDIVILASSNRNISSSRFIRINRGINKG